MSTSGGGGPLKPWQFLAYEMVLDLATVDARGLQDAQGHLRSLGLQVTTLAEALGDDPLAAEQVYGLHNQCHRLQPPAGVRQAPIPFHLWVWGSIEARGEALPDAYFIAMDGGSYVGLSSVVRVPRLPGVLHSRFTGVLGAYQGRGIARGLKAATIAYAVEHDYVQLRSTVLADNLAMLRVNESLGFVRRREFVQSYPQLVSSKPLSA